MKKGAYYKLVGSYEGVLWNGRRWQRFLCDGCVKQLGHAVGAPLQGPWSEAAQTALLGPVAFRHDATTHRDFLDRCHAINHPTQNQLKEL